MKIDERAKECRYDLGYGGIDINDESLIKTESKMPWGEVVSDIESAYKQGAIEQRSIDIDKACEWLSFRCVCGMNELDDFRRAMEKDYED